MTRTKRIYNNPRVKKTPRYNVDNDEYVHTGLPFTHRSWICMGNCHMCRDPKKEPKTIRKRIKQELRTELIREFSTSHCE